ncbi:MAG: hypothetical protein IMZ61_02305 [Planctomycetes bacterium]|nr:hypothetical protein [Planctomycetota bacterium]
MAENESQPDSKKKKDWSLAESVLDVMRLSPAESGQVVRQSEGALVSAQPSGVLPPALTIPLPDFDSEQGLYAQWQAKRLGRKAALERMALLYKGHQEVLKETIEQAVKMKKTQIASCAKAYLLQLDAEYIARLTKFEIWNAAARANALIELTDTVVAKIEEVEQKAWPAPLIKDTMDKVFALRERVIVDIMKELGAEFSKD